MVDKTKTNKLKRNEIPLQGQLRLQLADSSHFYIDLSGSDGFIIGRTDLKTRFMPDIDLGPFKGLDYGVSRRHAALVRYRNALHILDLGSINGTFLNGERLQPDIPQPLKQGDKLTFGELVVSIDKEALS